LTLEKGEPPNWEKKECGVSEPPREGGKKRRNNNKEDQGQKRGGSKNAEGQSA